MIHLCEEKDLGILKIIIFLKSFTMLYVPFCLPLNLIGQKKKIKIGV